MALTSTVTGIGAKGRHKFTLTVNEIATSNTANTSTLSWSFSIGLHNQGSGWAWNGEGTNIGYSVVINGTTVKTGSIPAYGGYDTETIASDSGVTVTHNAGGAKSINISFTVTDRDGESYTCGAASGSGTMNLTAISVASYALSISKDTGSTITVNRTSSPKGGGATGNLSNGAKVYYSDVLKITFGAESGYEIDTHTVNGTAFTSGSNHIVTSNVTVIATVKMLGAVYIDNGTTVEKYLVFIDTGTGWLQYVPYIDDGSKWQMCS